MLFDTDVLIWALHGSAKAAKEIDNDDSRFISAVNYMELMQGASFSSCGADRTAGRRILEEHDLPESPLFLVWGRK